MLQLSESHQSPQPASAAPLTSAVVPAAALDALPLPVIIVDAEMRILHANAAADELTAPGRSGLTVSRAGLGGTQLRARHRDDNVALRRLVAKAAVGEPGGALRVRGHYEDCPEEATLAVQVSTQHRNVP